jgi:putative oxidoreductase
MRAEQPRQMNSLKRFSDPIYCLMRLVVGLLFACHGAQKMLGMFGGQGTAEGKMMIIGIVELAGGFLIAFGLFTRLAAFLASGGMAWAYFSVHFAGKTIKHAPPITPAEHFFPILNGGEAAVLYCFVFLFIMFYGGGRFSLDALIFRRGETAVPAAT